TNETWQWTCTSAALSGTITNTATVSARDPEGDVASDSASATATLAAITLDKLSPASQISAPGEVTYSFTVNNTGEATLTSISISDPLTGPVTCPQTTLDPAASMTCTVSYVVTQADLDAGAINNTASVSGTAPDGSTFSASDTVSTPVVQSPSWTVTKTALSVPTGAGDSVDYSFVVTNTGNVSITTVVVDDPKCVAGPTLFDGDTDGDTVLDVGETWTFTCTSVPVTQTEVDNGQVDNTVTVTGTPAGGTLVDAVDTATTSITATGAVELIKSVVTTEPDPLAAPGDSILFSFVVTNTGNVTLSDVVLTDPLMSGVDCATDVLAFLAPDESVTCTSTYLLTQADVDNGGVENSASVSALDPSKTVIEDVSDSGGETPPGNDGTGDDDPTWVTIERRPALSMQKSVTSVAGNGDGSWDITWLLSIVNVGNVTLAGVQVEDDLLAGGASAVTVQGVTVSSGGCTPNGSYDGTSVIDLLIGTDELAPGAACVVSIPVELVPEAGVTVLENLATGSATGPSGAAVEDLSDAGDESVETPAADGSTDGDPTNDPTLLDLRETPDLGVAKALTEAPTMTASGEWTLRFQLIVENRGDVELRSVQVRDDLDMAFPGVDYSVLTVNISDGPCSLKGGYDGSAITSLLSGADVLAPGTLCTILLSISVRPDGRFVGQNQASATATSPGGTTLTDLSTSGTDADPNADGSTAEEEPTPIVLAPPAEPDEKLDNEPGASVTIELLSNDGAGAPLDPSTLVLVDPVIGLESETGFAVAGEGIWAVNGDGTVTFTPEAGFVGDPTEVLYRARLSGTDVWVSASVTITYLDPPPAAPSPEPAPTLALTGRDLDSAVALAVVLLLLGTLFVLAGRRRQFRVYRY
ncbi:MAG: hypothetical protein KJP22_01740, partial [Acidimicrobiia bacterium]|nr:hypothetical protein [Acidimicrobiia bacterium]